MGDPNVHDPTAPFDEFEIHLVASLGMRDGAPQGHPLDVLNSGEPLHIDDALAAAAVGVPVWWTVFGHRTGIGLTSIADVRTYEEAESLVTALSRTRTTPLG